MCTTKIAFYTLGCKVNQYETEALREIFMSHGYESVEEGELADVYVVNSCSVTGISDRKTRQFIRKTKKLNPESITVLTGCYAETGGDVVADINEIDIILGNAEKGHVFEEVDAFIRSASAGVVSGSSHQTRVIRTGNIDDVNEYDDYGLINGMDSRTRAYIKIEDGCDRFCSYCIIPHARGPVRSRPLSSILNETRQLLNKGYKELILVGINAALYGTDLSRNQYSDINPVNNKNSQAYDLIELIRQISDLPGEFRIRLSSLEPTVINSEYASRLIKIDKLCPHLHLSLQSGSDRILKSMGRGYTRKDYLDIVEVLKASDPNYSITTDIIVGYPGETENDFADSIAMVKEVGFSKVHVFKYSKRSGTPAASMENQIVGTIKNDRSSRLIDTAELSASEFLCRNSGTVRQALILEYESTSKLYHGITDNDIDIRIQSDSDIRNTFQMITL